MAGGRFVILRLRNCAAFYFAQIVRYGAGDQKTAKFPVSCRIFPVSRCNRGHAPCGFGMLLANKKRKR